MPAWTAQRIIRILKNICRDPKNELPGYFDSLLLRIHEKRLGIDTCSNNFSKENQGFFQDGSRYSPTGYLELEKMLAYLKLGGRDVFVDLGCGSGRVLFLAATRRLKKVIGVEVVRELAEAARDNLKKLKLRRAPVEIVNIDVCDFDPAEGTLFFMFNPFGQKTVAKVLENIRQSLVSHPRKIRIAYRGPVYEDLLSSQDWLVREGYIARTEILLWGSR